MISILLEFHPWQGVALESHRVGSALVIGFVTVAFLRYSVSERMAFLIGSREHVAS
jgi:hypothetical protein